MPEGQQTATPDFPTNLPQVAAIDTAASDKALDSQVGSILTTIPAAPPVTAPAYTSGHDSSSVNVPQPNIKPQVQTQSPVQGTEMDKKRARVHNNFASVQNLLRNFTNKKEEQKSEELKTNITTIMKAQQQIDNATSVLQNPTSDEQSKKMAQSVLDQNKKVIESKFADPKLSKQLQKAFNVSMTDSSANDTPEIKAAQAAQKEVKAATAHNIDANTPAEKQIAEAAKNGGNPPPVQDAQKTAQQASQSAKSNTPYTDKFLSQTPATMSANPEYQAQVAAQQKRDAQITQYVIPKLIDTYSKRDLEMLKQQGAANREEYKGMLQYQTDLNKLVNARAIADGKNATEIKKQGMADSSNMARTMLRVNAAMGAADAKGIKGTALAKKLQEQAQKDLTDNIDKVDKDNTELAAQLTALTKDANGKVINPDPDKAAAIQHSIDLNNLTRRQYADERQKLITKIYGTPTAGADDEVRTGNTAGYLNGGSNSNSSNSSESESGKSKPASVGSALSDSDSEDDEDKAIANY